MLGPAPAETLRRVREKGELPRRGWLIRGLKNSNEPGPSRSAIAWFSITIWVCAFVAVGIDLDEARRKREDNIVQLRKDRRDENLLKKRMVSTAAVQPGELETTRSTTSGVQQKVRQNCGGDAFTMAGTSVKGSFLRLLSSIHTQMYDSWSSCHR